MKHLSLPILFTNTKLSIFANPSRKQGAYQVNCNGVARHKVPRRSEDEYQNA